MEKDDKIVVINGKYKGRSGLYVKNCSAVFTDHCRIILELKGREREQKAVMILKSDIKAT